MTEISRLSEQCRFCVGLRVDSGVRHGLARDSAEGDLGPLTMKEIRDESYVTFDTGTLVSLAILGDAARRLEIAHSTTGQRAVPLTVGKRPFLGRETSLRKAMQAVGLHLLVGESGRMYVSVDGDLTPQDLDTIP